MADPTKRAKIAHEATAEWLTDKKVIGSPGEFDLDRKLSDYQILDAQLTELSQQISDALRKKAKIKVELPADLQQQLQSGTFGDVIRAFSALPGRPSTGMGGPIKPKPKGLKAL